MKKRLSIFLIGTAVSVVAVVGAFAGLAAAQSNDDDGDGQTFVERVAAVLGIESDDLESAMQQVKEEIRNERRDAKFDDLVENGTLTQEEADAIKEWQDAKPEIEFNFGDEMKAMESADGVAKDSVTAAAVGLVLMTKSTIWLRRASSLKPMRIR